MDTCCLALIVVLVLILIVVGGAWVYVRGLLRRLESIEGKLPTDQAVANIGYTGYLPSGLPTLDFDVDLGAFTLRACESAVNKRLGADPQLPKGLVEVGWVAGHALLLRVSPRLGPKDVFVVAIAGTLTYNDVRADFRDAYANFYGTHAHQGFVQTWEKIYPAVQALVSANPGAQFIVAGHSLGAAVATLVAAALGADYPGIEMALYASATPRTGSHDFIELLARVAPNHWHITNRADIVPTLPLSVSPVTSGPHRGRNVLYADFDRVVYFDAQSGTLANNHFTGSYLCALVGGKTCSLDKWVSPPRAVSWV